MLDHVTIHIGTHKTGSTAIQKWCHTNHRFLDQHGIYYPVGSSQKWGGHHPVAWACGINHPHKNPKIGLLHFKAELEKSNCTNLLLSSEDFEFLPPQAISRLKAMLNAKSYSIIVYVRNILDYLISDYQQNVRSYDTRYSADIMQFFIQFNMYNRLNYFSIMNRWANIFGRDAIDIALYDHAKMNLIQDFASRLPAQFDDLPSANKLVNKSLNSISVKLLQLANLAGQPSNERQDFIKVLLQLEIKADKDYSLLPAELGDNIVANLSHTIDLFEKLCGFDTAILRQNNLPAKTIIDGVHLQNRQAAVALELKKNARAAMKSIFTI